MEVHYKLVEKVLNVIFANQHFLVYKKKKIIIVNYKKFF